MALGDAANTQAMELLPPGNKPAAQRGHKQAWLTCSFGMRASASGSMLAVLHQQGTSKDPDIAEAHSLEPPQRGQITLGNGTSVCRGRGGRWLGCPEQGESAIEKDVMSQMDPDGREQAEHENLQRANAILPIVAFEEVAGFWQEEGSK